MARAASVEELPTGLRRGRKRFERWRRTRRKRKIPDELWREAVELAGSFGVSRTARALRLNATSLRERKDSRSQATPAVVASGPGPFVELSPLSMGSSPVGVVVMESNGGARMRIEIADGAVLDIGALALAFLAGQ